VTRLTQANLVAANATALSTHFLLEACPSYQGRSRARFTIVAGFRSIRGKRYLILGLIQTIGQIEFSVSTTLRANLLGLVAREDNSMMRRSQGFDPIFAVFFTSVE
jgi:hypothetical protein